MAGRKNFVAGEILTAADVNSFLMDQSVMVFDDSAARTTAIPTPTEGMVTYLKDTDSVEVFNGSSFVPASPAQTGVLQVVQTTKTDTFTTTSGTFTTITGLSLSITPKASSSKVLIMAQLTVSGGASGAVIDNDLGAFKVTRGGTDIYRGDAAGTNRQRAVFGGSSANTQETTYAHSIVYLDSPSTASPVTYQIETRRGRSGSTVYINRAVADSDFEYIIRGASSLTLMEVAG